MNRADTAPSLNLWDRVGLLISTACLLHCLIVPFAILLLPALSQMVPENEWVHIVLALLTIPVASIAFMHGYRRHGSAIPSACAVPGISLFYLSLLVPEPHWAESIIASAGSLLLASGHILNHRYSCRCQEAG